jgi:hypothetical protein
MTMISSVPMIPLPFSFKALFATRVLAIIIILKTQAPKWAIFAASFPRPKSAAFGQTATGIARPSLGGQSSLRSSNFDGAAYFFHITRRTRKMHQRLLRRGYSATGFSHTPRGENRAVPSLFWPCNRSRSIRAPGSTPAYQPGRCCRGNGVLNIGRCCARQLSRSTAPSWGRRLRFSPNPNLRPQWAATRSPTSLGWRQNRCAGIYLDSVA